MVTKKSPRKASLPNSTDLLKYLKSAYPDFHFSYANRFKYRYPDHIYIERPPSNPENHPYPPAHFALQTLHELGHALRKHKDYTEDLSRLKIEREAWETAKTIYNNLPDPLKTPPFWDETYVESSLDTYRDWLHSKSRCKTCGLTRYQTPDGHYHCPRCEAFLRHPKA